MFVGATLHGSRQEHPPRLLGQVLFEPGQDLGR